MGGLDDIIARNQNGLLGADPRQHRADDRRKLTAAAIVLGVVGVAIAAWLVLKRPAGSAPDGTVFDRRGNLVELSSLWSDRRVVVAFYPTLTCDDCRLGLKNMNSQQGVLDATLIAISARQDQLEERREELGLTFDVYADPSLAVFRAWGIPDLKPNVPMLATFIIEPGGVISYRKICDGTTICPEGTDFLKVPLANVASNRKSSRDRQPTDLPTKQSTAAEPSTATATTTSTNAPNTAGDKAATRATWWCFSFHRGEIGGCFQQIVQCQMAVANLRKTSSPTEQFQDCSIQQDVVCFDSAKRNSSSVEQLCHPTFAICRSHADHLRSNPDRGLQVMSKCSRQAGPATSSGADQDEAAHWWCFSADHSTGSCDRSRTQCEASRNFALRNLTDPNFKISVCMPQRSAMCFESRDASTGTRTQCSPTPEMCHLENDFEKHIQGKNPREVTDCHSMD